MSIERFARKNERSDTTERMTVVIRAADAVIRELLSDGSLERKSRDAQRVVERILRANNRGKKVVVAGETKAVAAWICEVSVRCVEIH